MKKVMKKKAAAKKATPKTASKKAAKTAKSAMKAVSGPNTKEMRNNDIVQIILQDHKPLKQLIAIMKDGEKSLSQRKRAFEQFCPLLVTHAMAEEEALYTFMKSNKDLREDGFEGDVEHGLADQMIEEAKRADDADLFSARVKVLAELVEHHIEEEENEQFPELKKEVSAEKRAEIGREYLLFKQNVKADGNLKNPEVAEKPHVEDDAFVQH